MENYILDRIVNNVIHKKKALQTQLNQVAKTFGSSFEKEINERKVQERVKVVNEYKSILKELMEIPRIEQRSEEWYRVRNNLITASDFAQSIGKGKFSSQNQFYKNKCGYENNVLDMSVPALQWGVRYEEVANMFYQFKMNVDVHEFGLLPHPEIDFVGASPDGISSMGIMLEFKCPWKRQKTETIPEQYYYQIQGQLEVCKLNECDYIECYIKEYVSYEDMMNDDKTMYKGMIWKKDDQPYQYSKINDFEHDENNPADYYYGIHDYFLKRVYRDEQFFKEIIVEIEKVWKNILIYRSDETEYRKAIRTVAKKPRSATTTKSKPKGPMFRVTDPDDLI